MLRTLRMRPCQPGAGTGQQRPAYASWRGCQPGRSFCRSRRPAHTRGFRVGGTAIVATAYTACSCGTAIATTSTVQPPRCILEAGCRRVENTLTLTLTIAATRGQRPRPPPGATTAAITIASKDHDYAHDRSSATITRGRSPIAELYTSGRTLYFILHTSGTITRGRSPRPPPAAPHGQRPAAGGRGGHYRGQDRHPN